MQVEGSDCHLTYCLNVHAGTAWADQFAAIQATSKKLHERIAPGTMFGLGLWLGARAVDELLQPGTLREFRNFLEHDQLYVFTLNAFPYGAFHGERVKERVYQPDWTTAARRDYTCRAADVLSELLPSGMTGSISSVPLGYKFDGKDTETTIAACIVSLMDVVVHLDALFQAKGTLIQLALEPEPDCLLENTQECIDFFARLRRDGREMLAKRLRCKESEAEALIVRYIGVCLDTCHFSVGFESPAAALHRFADAGIAIPKLQISAALKGDPAAMEWPRLEALCDPVYLHQTRFRATDGAVQSYRDLPEALTHWQKWSSCDRAGDSRIHFHVPLYFSSHQGLQSTSDELDAAFFDEVQKQHITHCEIETYTFDVLPDELKCADIIDSIAREYAWTLERI